MLVAGTDQDPGDVRDTMAELKHFFLIFILPFILITAGIAEYRITKKLLHQAVGMSQPAVMKNVEQPAGGDG
jgi:hypothetical protein